MIASLGTHAFKALTPQTAVRVDRSRCVRHRCKRNECGRCIDVCPVEAISWTEDGLQVEDFNCTQCLACLSVCPTSALEPPELSLVQSLKDLAGHVNPVLGCHQVPSGDAHARFSCLGVLAHPELMTVLALVFTRGLQINMSSCRECPNGHTLDGVQKVHLQLAEIYPNHQIRIVFDQKELNCQPETVSRRELFQLFKSRSSRTAALMIGRIQGTGEGQSFGNKQIPLIRSMVLKLMAELPENQSRQIADQLFGNISFTSECTACDGCVGICPTGAIEPTEENSSEPSFNPELCVDCGSCAAFCLKDGVKQVVG